MFAYINFFYVFASHYCRAKTKKYLEAGLTIEKIDDLYKEK